MRPRRFDREVEQRAALCHVTKISHFMNVTQSVRGIRGKTSAVDSKLRVLDGLVTLP